MSFANREIRGFPDLELAVEGRQPGDWVMLTVQRDQAILALQGALDLDPGVEFERTEFLDGRAGRLSRRRTGFPAVIQHDIAVQPEECGGPLVDGNGRLVGVNIARRARESTLAIPISVVKRFCERRPR